MFNRQPATLREALNPLDSEMLRLLGCNLGPVTVTRKIDRIGLIVRRLEGDGLAELVRQLDTPSRNALAQAVHDPRGYFDQGVFRARYGQMPPYDSGYYSRPHKLIDVFIIDGFVPRDIQARLKNILPPPPPVEPESVKELPEEIEGRKLAVLRTERAAMEDVLSLLHFIKRQGIALTASGQRVSAAGIRLVRENLSKGETFPEPKVVSSREDARTGSWPYLFSIGGLLVPSEKRMELTPAGSESLFRPPEETIRIIWDHWAGSDSMDEMVEAGPYLRKLMNMLPPGEQRRRVLSAMSRHPAGEWIGLASFDRYLRVNGMSIFPAMTTPMYFFGPEADRAEAALEAFNLHYLRILLWDAMSVMGAVDLAISLESPAKPDREMDIARVKYFRVNSLGRYLLGLAPAYVAPENGGEARAFLKVLPTLEVVTPEKYQGFHWEPYFLDRIAERTSEHVWKLDRKKLLEAMESGIPLARVRRMLESGGPLPDTVRLFLHDTELRETALVYSGEAILFEARDAATADLIAHERKLHEICFRTGEKMVVVYGGKRKEFLRGMKALGYLVRIPEETEER